LSKLIKDNSYFDFCFPSPGFSFIYSEFIFIILAFASGDLAISALGWCMTFVISGGERSWPYRLLLLFYNFYFRL
jgi:hypothetical protein